MYVCFVNNTKAFDSIQWSKLWTVLLEMETSKHLVALIRRLYEKNRATVRINNVMFNRCSARMGVRQSYVFSPLLFNIYSEYATRLGWLAKWDCYE